MVPSNTKTAKVPLPFSLSVRWMEQTGLIVSATCGYPAELRGQNVREVDVFKNCSAEKPHVITNSTSLIKTPKSSKPKPTVLNGGTTKPSNTKPKPKPSKTKLRVKPSVAEPNRPLKSALKTAQRKNKKIQ